METQLFSMMKDLGLMPAELLIIWLLWQNLKQIKNSLSALEKNFLMLDKRIVILELKHGHYGEPE